MTIDAVSRRFDTAATAAAAAAAGAAACAALPGAARLAAHAGATVLVVDDDASVRLALSALLRSVSLDCRSFGSAQEFLAAPAPEGPACVLLDMRLQNVSGLQVQQAVAERARALPVIFLTGFGTIPMTVRAMQAGAVEFLTKPFAEHTLLAAVARALDQDRDAMARREADRLQQDTERMLQQRHASLTPRERQVMDLVVAGLLNKQAAAQLGTSEITIKVHRRQVMTKMQARSLPDLVRMASTLAARRPC